MSWCNIESYLIGSYKIIPYKKNDNFYFLKNYLEFKFNLNLLKKKKKIYHKKKIKKPFNYFFNIFKKFNKYLPKKNNQMRYFFLFDKFNYYQKPSKIKFFFKIKKSFWLQIQLCWWPKKYFKKNILGLNYLTIIYAQIDYFFEIFRLLFLLSSVKNRNKILFDHKKINKILNSKKKKNLNFDVFRRLVYDYCIIKYQIKNTKIYWKNYFFCKLQIKKKKKKFTLYNKKKGCFSEAIYGFFKKKKSKNNFFYLKKNIFDVLVEKIIGLFLYFKKFSLQYGYFSKFNFFFKINNKLPIRYNDNKPLPKWIINSHKLKCEYKCNLCYGYIFRGLKSYFYHFFNISHTNKLFQLGVKIGDEHNFVGITKINQIKNIIFK
jgi:hypothetical protein